MKTQYRQQSNLFQSKLKNNALLQLVLAIGVFYIIMHGVKVILIIIAAEPKSVFSDSVLPNLALQPFGDFIKKPWVLLTYFWGHGSFWNLVSNMLWLYCFGSVIQTLTGYKEIILLFISSCVLSGIFYLGVNAFWPEINGGYILTSLPGVTAFAAGAIALAPRYRFYLGERFAIPIWIVLTIFILLNVLSYVHDSGLLLLIGLSSLIGGIYAKMIQYGFRPGQRIYQFTEQFSNQFAPDPYQFNSQKRTATFKKYKHDHPQSTNETVDKILDKINQKGFSSLTQEEKDILEKASKEIS